MEVFEGHSEKKSSIKEGVGLTNVPPLTKGGQGGVYSRPRPRECPLKNPPVSPLRKGGLCLLPSPPTAYSRLTGKTSISKAPPTPAVSPSSRIAQRILSGCLNSRTPRLSRTISLDLWVRPMPGLPGTIQRHDLTQPTYMPELGQRSRIILSRTHPDLRRRLFESEVPEITDQSVTIPVLVARPDTAPRWRSTRARQHRSRHGLSCALGTRIKSIVDELGGELP